MLKSSKRDKYRGAKPPPDVPKLKVYPNPAKGYIIVEYHLDNDPKGCYIEISDITGRKITKVLLLGKENQKVVPVIDYPSGTYIASLFVDGRILETAKFNIVK